MTVYLETAICLVLIFVVFSIVTYVIQELIAVNLEYRGNILLKSLSQLLDGYVVEKRKEVDDKEPEEIRPNTKTFFEHPQIISLRKELDKLPSYVPAANFALAIMNMVAEKAPAAEEYDQLKKIREGLKTFADSNGNIFKVLKNLADTSESIKELQKKIEDWYNSYMDRVTGWYKSHVVVTTRWIALGVTLFFNVNVIKLTTEVLDNSQLRASLSRVAEHTVDHPETINTFYKKSFEQISKNIDSSYQQELDSAATEGAKSAIRDKIANAKSDSAEVYTKKSLGAIDTLIRNLNTTNLPIGWGLPKEDISKKKDKGKVSLEDKSNVVVKALQNNFKGRDGKVSLGSILWVLIGWFIAAGCISMGAPFWFELLVKLVNIRRAGVKPTAGEEKRQ